jgi:hypothetical protein
MSVIDELRNIGPIQTDREKSHPDQLWRASLLHDCYRKQILAAKGYSLANSPQLLRKLSLRGGAHDEVQDWLRLVPYQVDTEVKVYNSDWSCGGHIDAIIVDQDIAYMVEVKTYAFLRGDVKADSYWQKQVSFYYDELSRPHPEWTAVIPIVMIVTLEGQIRLVDNVAYTDSYIEDLVFLNVMWDTDTLPSYGDCHGENCGKCPLQPICTEPIKTISDFMVEIERRAVSEQAP